MPHPTVYLETTVIGHLVGRIHPNAVVAERQRVTREWWATAAEKYRLLVSQIVANECSEGDRKAAAERLDVVNSCTFLKGSTAVDELAESLHRQYAVPGTETRDALHISFAAVNCVEYLLTWNFKHIANPTTKSLIERVCREAGFVPPIICSPEVLLGEVDDI